MRIHSDFLEEADVRKAATVAGVAFTRFTLHGSRKRAGAFDVILTGSSSRNQNNSSGEKAATWDEWGIFLGALFSLDANAHATYYENAEHFHWSTGGRFRPGILRPSTQHAAGHNWQYAGHVVTGSYSVSECECGALRRWLREGTWAEFTAANG